MASNAFEAIDTLVMRPAVGETLAVDLTPWAVLRLQK